MTRWFTSAPPPTLAGEARACPPRHELECGESPDHRAGGLAFETTGRSGSPHEGEDREDDKHEDNDTHDADAADPFCKHGAPFVGGANCPDDTARAPSGSFAVGLMHPYPHEVAGKRKENGRPLVPVNAMPSMNAPRDRPMPYARAVDIAPVLEGSTEGNAEGF